MPHILSWNVAYRYERLPEQLAAVLDRAPDLLALQEVTAQTAPRWREGLMAAGYAVVTTFDLAADPVALTGPRKYGQMVASRWPVEALPLTTVGAPWPERVLSAVVHTPSGPVEIHTAHLPTGVGHLAEKIGTFERIGAYVEREASRPRLLCGDFNSPQEELPDGSIMVFGQSRWRDGSLRDQGDGAQARAERLVFPGLQDHGMCDAYRQVHGYGTTEWSWTRQIWSKPCGGRFDHVFASREFTPMGCQYHHEWRDEGLSDHAPIEVNTVVNILQ